MKSHKPSFKTKKQDQRTLKAEESDKISLKDEGSRKKSSKPRIPGASAQYDKQPRNAHPKSVKSPSVSGARGKTGKSSNYTEVSDKGSSSNAEEISDEGSSNAKEVSDKGSSNAQVVSDEGSSNAEEDSVEGSSNAEEDSIEGSSNAEARFDGGSSNAEARSIEGYFIADGGSDDGSSDAVEGFGEGSSDSKVVSDEGSFDAEGVSDKGSNDAKGGSVDGSSSAKGSDESSSSAKGSDESSSSAKGSDESSSSAKGSDESSSSAKGSDEGSTIDKANWFENSSYDEYWSVKDSYKAKEESLEYSNNSGTKEPSEIYYGFAFLPIEVLHIIFKNLSFTDLLFSSRTCSQWRKAANYSPFWSRCSYIVKRENLLSFFEHLETKLELIEVLEIKCKSLLNPLENRPEARPSHQIILDVPYASPEESLMFTKAMVGMKKLVCLKCFIHFDITYLPETLKHLYLVPYGWRANEDMINISKVCPSLERFTFYTCGSTRFPIAGIDSLLTATGQNLQNLAISTWSLNGGSINIIYQCSNIVSLCLWQCKFTTPNCLSAIGGLRFLKHLHLDFPISNRNYFWFLRDYNETYFFTLTYFSILTSSASPELAYDIFVSLHMRMPNLKTLCVESTDANILDHSIKIYINNSYSIRNVILRNQRGGGKQVNSNFMMFLHQACVRKPFLKICICNLALEYQFVVSQRNIYQFYDLFRKTNFQCNICHLFNFPFMCDCFN